MKAQENMTAEDAARGFELYLANQAVVYNAVWRSGLVKSKRDPRFQELVEDGMWLYQDFYLHYTEPLNTVAEIQRFNKLAGPAIVWRLQRLAKGASIRLQFERAAAADPATGQQELVSPTDNTGVEETIRELHTTLTAIEWRAFVLSYEGWHVPEIAKRLRRSERRIRQVRQEIQRKYKKLMA